MSYAVYVFVDAVRQQQKIRSNEVNWTGTWTASGTYFAASYDTLLYGSERYVAIIDNPGVNPTAKLPNRQPNPFAHLSIFQAGDEPPFSPPISPDAVYYATQLAWQGTAAAAAAYAAAAGFGTVSTASATAGTLFYDFSGSACQVTTVDQDVWVNAVNQVPGVELRIALVGDGAPHSLGYGSFQWFDAPPAFIQDKPVLLRLLATSAGPSGIFATARVGI